MSADFSFDAWVDDLELVVDARGRRPLPAARRVPGRRRRRLRYAVRHPERVEQLILAGAYGRGRLVRARTGEDDATEAALDLDIVPHRHGGATTTPSA